MARIALNNEEKDLMKDYGPFQTAVEWAMINKARYWLQLDGSSVPGNDRIKWAKSRQFSHGIINHVDKIEYSRLFVIFLTQQVHEPSNDTGGLNREEIVQYMESESIFEQLADSIFDEKIKTIIF